METRVIARVLLFDENGRILLLTRSRDDNYRPGGFDVPGGNVDPTEDYADAAVRETLEEAGVQLMRTDIYLVCAYSEVGYHSQLKVDINYVCLGFAAKLPLGKTEITLSHEHDDFAWYELTEALNIAEGASYGVFLEHIVANNLQPDLWKHVKKA